MNIKFHHIHLKARDPEKTAAWYGKAFGFKVAEKIVRPAGDLFTGMVVEVRPLAGGSGLRLVATRAGILLYCVFGVLGIDPRRQKKGGRAKVRTARTH